MSGSAKPRAAGSGQPRILDTSDARRPGAVAPFPGFKKRFALSNLALYLGVVLTACTLILRNRVYALPAMMFGIAACFNAETLFVENGFGPMQIVTFAGLAFTTTYTPLLLDLTPKFVSQTPVS